MASELWQPLCQPLPMPEPRAPLICEKTGKKQKLKFWGGVIMKNQGKPSWAPLLPYPQPRNLGGGAVVLATVRSGAGSGQFSVWQPVGLWAEPGKA